MSTLFPSLALSSKKAPAMSFFELSPPQNVSTRGLLSRIGQTFVKAMNALQYSRMMHAMSQLTNEQLDIMGIERCDIPDIAYKTIYET